MSVTETQVEPWAKLRQVAIAATDFEGSTALLRDRFALPEGFGDPELPKIGMADSTMPVGPDSYLEIIAPVDESNHLHRWLAKVGGSGAYCLSVQVPDVAAIRQRAADAGVRVAIDTEAFGKPVLQLHPKDLGVLLEFDEIADRQVWFWDDVTPGPSADATIDEIIAVEVGVADPEASATLWAHLADVEKSSSTSVDYGAEISFVRADVLGVQAITVRLRPGAAPAAPEELLGVEFRFVAEPADAGDARG